MDRQINSPLLKIPLCDSPVMGFTLTRGLLGAHLVVGVVVRLLLLLLLLSMGTNAWHLLLSLLGMMWWWLLLLLLLLLNSWSSLG